MKKSILTILILISSLMSNHLSAQNIFFPDRNLKAELIAQGLDKNGDGSITIEEARGITSLDISNKNIYDISGLNKFYDLDTLICHHNYISSFLINLSDFKYIDFSYNKFTELDFNEFYNALAIKCNGNSFKKINISNLKFLVSLECTYSQLDSISLNNLSNLVDIKCNNNKITYLSINNTPKLSKLECDNNRLTNLDVSSLSNLSTLSCNSNRISSIDVSNLSNLSSLSCNSNRLTSLDLNNLINLEYLNCSVNSISSIDLLNTPKLSSLFCNNNKLTNLNIYENSKLSILNCYSNQLLTLNLSNALELTSLNCNSNSITNLNTSNLSKLTTLKCSENQIQNLDLSDSKNLIILECWNNKLTNLNLSNSSKISNLNCNNNLLTSLVLSNETNLETLYCSNNQLTSLDLKESKLITQLTCSNNKITNLDISKLESLNFLYCENNEIENLKTGQLINLVDFYCQNNQIKSLDVSKSESLEFLDCTNNPIEHVYINCGGWDFGFKIFNSVPNLKSVCAKNCILEEIKQAASAAGYNNVVISSFCESTSAGVYYTLNGQSKLDLNNDGCDETDMAYSNLKIKITNDTETGYIITGNDGTFSTDLNGGIYTFQPILDHPNYYSSSPQSATFSLNDSIIPAFCITPNGVHNDLSISVIPVRAARPGFSDATYKVVYKNQGTTTQNGTVTFNYDEVKMNFISASPIADNKGAGNVRFDFTNLAPFDTRFVLIKMRTNAPTDNPAVNSGDVLEFTAAIIGDSDETPNDNLAILTQTVVGSFDPNDKTCLEGEIVSPELIGKNVHYLIRFENTGTANAENIVVTDYIDTTVFEISTLQITDASHICHTQISQGNKVQFIFSNIQLPFTESNKHGYVAFSIKLKENLVIGDSIKNKADIFFDYNLPVETNIASAEINYKTVTYIGENQTIKGSLDIYPNPSNGQFALELKANIKAPVQISILNVEGKVVFSKTINHQNQSNLFLDLKHLAKGVYLIKAQIENDVLSKKVVIQ